MSGPRVPGIDGCEETSFLNAILKMRLKPRGCLLDTGTLTDGCYYQTFGSYFVRTGQEHF